ncbi:MAG: hypothetical protein ABL921_28330 [Pirellula sp.]
MHDLRLGRTRHRHGRLSRFFGTQCRFVGKPGFSATDGAEFTGNTILYPEKWIFRILQETTAEGFASCRNVTIQGNKISFRRSQVQVEINVGSGTDPESFRFANNIWFCEDRPESSKPRLPTPETGGTYGVKSKS